MFCDKIFYQVAEAKKKHLFWTLVNIDITAGSPKEKRNFSQIILKFTNCDNDLESVQLCVNDEKVFIVSNDNILLF